MSTKKIRLALVDDEVLFRKGIAFLLAKQPDISIVFEASNGEELLEHLSKNNKHPAVILMDLKMPLVNGIEVTKQINLLYPTIKVVALTSYNSPTFIANIINVGAAAYLVKTSDPEDVLFVIRKVVEKGFYYDSTVIKTINKKASTSTKSILDANFLSDRELEILNLICQQFNTKEIAEKLFLSNRTIDWHRNNLLLKTNSKNLAGLVVFAFKNKLVNTDRETL